MRKVIGYILSPIFYVVFALLLFVFHPIQWLCLKFFGYTAHKNCVDLLNGFLVACYYILFNRVRFVANKIIPTGRPIIFVANHQSMYDIPPLIFFLRKYHAKFVSKIELAHAGIPSISFNLKHGGAANIDRKDSKQSVHEILRLAKKMNSENWSVFIFPEGTRSKTGRVNSFSVGGVATILKKNPQALIVPIAINNSYKMVQWGMFPLRPFTSMSWEVMDPINTLGQDVNEIVKQCEVLIKSKLHQI